jgi:UDP-N-acetylglucosamine 4,6-dehydratase
MPESPHPASADPATAAGAATRPPFDWARQTVLITGGTGSFGRAMTRLLLREQRPAKLIVFSRDELKQHEMRTGGFDDPSLRWFIGDVRDEGRLRRAMRGVTCVVHAAALKHVPVCEYNPFEAVQTNIMGARNVINAALDQGVERVIALSTDKAANPINLYGATKLVAEKLFVQANAYSGQQPIRFACCRYGNVVGSRGSVVPLFREQRSKGVVTVTDPRMTRFWLTLDQGVRFVAHCLERMHGGEIFVPKIPSMRLVDLAQAVAPDCRLQSIGIRPGEKLHEVLVGEDEARTTRDLGDCFVIQPAHPWWHDPHREVGAPLPEGFSYTSNGNPEWLSIAELRRLVEDPDA